MLEYLHIENVAVAKNVDINFKEGLNVLTGETGAGKSIIIQSINLILGSKISKDIIRSGEEKALVSAIFSNIDSSVQRTLDELDIGYEDDDKLIITRSYSIDGKSSIKINAKPATLSQLKILGAKLLNIHGQNETLNYVSKSNQINLLDEYSNNKNELIAYRESYDSLTALKNQISELLENIKQKEMLTDILNYQIKEISVAGLKDLDEEEKLNSLKIRLKSAEKLTKQTSIVYRALLSNENGVSATVLIEKAIESLEKLVEYDETVNESITKLKDFSYEIEDIAEKTKAISCIDDFTDPKKQLEIVEDRLSLIKTLEKKYGPSISEILKFKKEAENKLKLFEDSEGALEDLKIKYKHIYAEAVKQAEKLLKSRLESAIKINQSVNDALSSLDMPRVHFEIKISKTEKDGKIVLSQNGCCDVDFLISTNPGEALMPIDNVASGGELSRIMLALKSAISVKNGADTIIFDEIDAGVSGSTAQKIGVRLYEISKGSQVICVTHSAQIAAFADTHMLIKKTEVNNRSETSIRTLNEDDKIKELARIIGGINIIDIQYEAARELINESKRLMN